MPPLVPQDRRDREFSDLFDEAGGNTVRVARLLEEMLPDYPDRRQRARPPA